MAFCGGVGCSVDVEEGERRRKVAGEEEVVEEAGGAGADCDYVVVGDGGGWGRGGWGEVWEGRGEGDARGWAVGGGEVFG